LSSNDNWITVCILIDQTDLVEAAQGPIDMLIADILVLMYCIYDEAEMTQK